MTGRARGVNTEHYRIVLTQGSGNGRARTHITLYERGAAERGVPADPVLVDSIALSDAKGGNDSSPDGCSALRAPPRRVDRELG